MLPRIAHSLFRAKALTVVTGVTILGGAVLFGGIAGASPGSAGPAAVTSPSPSASSTSGSILPPTTASSSPTASSSLTSSPTATADPTASTTTDPTATATATTSPAPSELVALDGIAGSGFSPGCIVFKSFDRHLYQLLVPKTATPDGFKPIVDIPFGVPLRVFASPAGKVASYCMEGAMVDVLGTTQLTTQ